MKAVQFGAYGDVEVLEINDNVPVPEVKEGEILVTVAAVGINPVDVSIMGGLMKEMLPLTLPFTWGGDFAGRVTKVGSKVVDLAEGDELYGLASPFMGGSGAVAEMSMAQAAKSAKKPTNIDMIEAASMPLVGTSAIQAIEEHIKLKTGQKILIHGGAGGIGTIAIQVAKANGAYVATTVSGDDVPLVSNLGADEVIDYTTQDFTKMVHDFDAVFDTTRAETANKSLTVLKAGGVLVSMTGQADEAAAKKQKVTAINQRTEGTTQQLLRLKELVEAGKVKPVVDQTFAMDQTKEAYSALKQHPKGKVVITIV